MSPREKDSKDPFDDLYIYFGKEDKRGYLVQFKIKKKIEFSGGHVDLSLAAWQPPTATQAAGEALFKELIKDERLKEGWRLIFANSSRYRIRLDFSEGAQKLSALPWELLRQPADDEQKFAAVDFAASETTPFSRYISVDQEPAEPIDDLRIRIAVAIANPKNLSDYGFKPIDVDAEWTVLEQATRDPRVEVIRVSEPCTLAALEGAIQQGVHILHIVAHGKIVDDLNSEREEGSPSQQTLLYLANTNNEVEPVSTEQMVKMLGRNLGTSGQGLRSAPEHLRLIFLASCQSATPLPTAAFSALAPELVRAGVPVVLAMQALVPEVTNRAFTDAFYHQLLSHGFVDLAANQARSRLLSGAQPGAHIPVLFMHMDGSQIFQPTSARAALAAISQDERFAWFAPEKGQYLPLPVEVIHLTPDQEVVNFEVEPVEPTASLDILQALKEIYPDPPAAEGQHKPLIVALVGGYGSNRSTQLKRIVWETAQRSLRAGATPPIVPVYINLDSAAQIPLQNGSIEELLNHGLQEHWTRPEDRQVFNEELARNHIVLRFVFQSSDNFSNTALDKLLVSLGRFANTYPQHQFIISVTRDQLKPELLSSVQLHTLLLQPIDRRKLRHFLYGLPADDPAGRPLLQRLDETGLYDLAAIPWFMVTIVNNARNGHYPISRTQVLGDMVDAALENAVKNFADKTDPERAAIQEHTLTGHMARILSTLAWQMQSDLTNEMATDEVFALMKRIRGDREYSLEAAHAALVQEKLLGIAPNDATRFAYSLIQAYCCAKAIVRTRNRERRLDDISSTLGRLSRLRWWEDTLVLACGLMARENPKASEEFLSTLIYGMNILESDRTFLAARCLSEATPFNGPLSEPLTAMAETVTAALIWRLDNVNEPNSVHRSRAATLLGQIATEDGMRELAKTAYARTRKDRNQDADFDYSNVRMAAVIGLLRMDEAQQKEVLQPINSNLITMLGQWRNSDVEPLLATICNQANPADQGLAALALGDLYMQLKLHPQHQAEAQEALDALVQAFFQSDINSSVQWAVSYSLATIDLPTVKRAVFDPFFNDEAAYARPQEQLVALYKCLAYLIGLLRWQDPRAGVFLRDRCMLNTKDASLAAVAIDSLARLADRRDKALLERIALACPNEREAPCFNYLTEKNKLYLRRKAIDALAAVGDMDTLTRLRSGNDSANPKDSRPPVPWDPQLQQSLYRTSEEIYWRVRPTQLNER